MVEDVGPRIHDDLEAVVRAVEVRDEDLDPHARGSLAHLADGPGEDRCAAVGQVVAGDRGDDHVLEMHRRDGLGDATPSTSS